MNNKGFTLVEVIAVVAILGIMSGVAIMGVSKYLSQSKAQAYSSMEKSAKAAAISYAIDNNINDTIDIRLSELVEYGYLENPIDPNKKGRSCAIGRESKVRITVISDRGGLTSYNVLVYLDCPSGYHTNNF